MTVRLILRLISILGLCASLSLSADAAKPPKAAAKPAKAEEPAKAAEAAAPGVSFAIAPPKPWVRLLAVDPTPSTETVSGGIFYVLVDQQENVEPRASYFHEARRITSENGVQNGASISVSFDPSYQRLVFHTIRLVRGGVASDRLDRSQIKLLQREEELESFLYDGSYTAYCQLEDVRVGDVIEYAYTIEGANPILRGKYFDTFSTEWSIPVQQATARVVYPSTRHLHFLIKNRNIEPAITKGEENTEWLWDEPNIPARHMDGQTPKGYNPYGIVQVSEFADWKEVAAWAVPLYQVDAEPSPELQQQISRFKEIENPEDRILAALRFVQDEVRYLGIESGVGSHQPTAPSEVLRRRFGDCKDKTLLLGTILRQTGLTATPSLVSTGLRNYITERLPSPGLFNHVILQVETNEGSYWLDATRSQQRGHLNQVYIGNFGQALVLRPGTTELTPFAPPAEALPRRNVVETYRIRAPGEAAGLDVVSEFHGVSAEITRAYFQNNPKETIQKNYLQFYARRYPGIQSVQPVDFAELPNDAGCLVNEHYTIPGIWELSDDKNHYRLSLYPADVDQDMGTPGSSQRTDPLALNHPVNVTQEIRAEMFQKWSLEPIKREVANAFFRYTEETKATGSQQLSMRWSYQTLAEKVPPADLPEYDAALRKIKDKLGYTFTYRTPTQLAASQPKSPSPVDDPFNWPVAIMLGVIVAAAVPSGIRYYHASKLPSPLPPSLTDRSLEGLGGWLIVVAIGLVVRPLLIVYSTSTFWPTIFHGATWQNLTSAGHPAYHPYWMPVLLFDLIYNTLAVIFCLLLLFLFFKKRAAWPRCFIVFLVSMICGLVVELFLGQQIPAAAEGVKSSVNGLGKMIFGAAIWIPYCLVSKRVKATFRY